MTKRYNIELFNGEKAIIIDTDKYKVLKSNDYNFFFNKENGFFIRWGLGDYTKKRRKLTQLEFNLYLIWCNIWEINFDINEFSLDLDTDGSLDVSACEILDWEISEKCEMGCTFCYKSNTQIGKNLDFESFKNTFDKLPPSITTIAYGIGDIKLQPDLWKILKYTKDNGIIPTITINGNATENDLNNLVKYCGAVAVSVYDKEISYNCVKGLTDRGLKQCNIHFMVSTQTENKAYEVMNDIKNDSRLKELNALVMLSLKEKGRSIGRFTKLSQDKFDKLFKYALDNEIGLGYDSCSAAKCFNFIDKNPQYKYMKQYIDPCEAGGIYSAYLNVDSEYFPCSFTEGTKGWKNGLKIKDDFMNDIWFNEKTQIFKNQIKKCRICNIGCPIFDV